MSAPDWRRGVLLGTVELVDVVEDCDSPWAMDDMRHWVLRDPPPFPKPVPIGGRQGWWEADVSMIERAILRQYGIRPRESNEGQTP